MQRLAFVPALVLSCVFCVAMPAQDSRPASPQIAKNPAKKLVKKREGGFYGIWFAETQNQGRTVLEIRSVLKGSDAERLGFKKGDLITAVNDKAVGGGDQFIKLLYATLPGRIGARMRRGQRPRGKTHAAPRKNHFTLLRQDKEIQLAGGFADLDATPKVGDRAPDFTLARQVEAGQEGEAERVTLSDLIGQKPVVLVFGSFT